MKHSPFFFLIITVIIEAEFSFQSEAEKADEDPVQVAARDLFFNPPEEEVDVRSRIQIKATIANGYAIIETETMITNMEMTAQDIEFSPFIPHDAYISYFDIEVEGASYKTSEMASSEAARLYSLSLQQGRYNRCVRHANRLDLKVNVDSEKNVTFKLTYEKLLKRKGNRYEAVINIFPDGFIDDIQVRVTISDISPLSLVGVVPLRTGHETFTEQHYAPNATIDIVNERHAIVDYRANECAQFYTARSIGTLGYGVQFVVQYDVERDSTKEKVITNDEYFAYSFAPSNLDPLPKHVVFLVDINVDVNKVIDAISHILDKLDPQDIFSLIRSGNVISVQNIVNQTTTEISSNFDAISTTIGFEVTYATDDNIRKAKDMLYRMVSMSDNDMIEGLKTALLIANRASPRNHVPMIIFLSTTAPNLVVTDEDEILKQVTNYNRPSKVPIFCWSLGNSASRNLLEKIALKNFGGYRRIYDEYDTSIQAMNLFDQISTPLLKNVRFNYPTAAVDDISRTEFPLYFAGSEIVIAGHFNGTHQGFLPTMTGETKTGGFVYTPQVDDQVDVDGETMSSYLSLKHKNELLKTSDNPDPWRKQYIDKALRASLVTPLTAEVITDPTNNNAYAILTEVLPQDSGYFNLTLANTTTTADVSQLLNALPWLKSMMNRDNTITVKQVRYSLGYKMDIPFNFKCVNHNNPKTCKLLHDCQTFVQSLRSSKDFVHNFCALDRYAGICCPN